MIIPISWKTIDGKTPSYNHDVLRICHSQGFCMRYMIWEGSVFMETTNDDKLSCCDLVYQISSFDFFEKQSRVIYIKTRESYYYRFVCYLCDASSRLIEA